MNQFAKARAAYNEAGVLTASPERLVVMLYDGAIRFLYSASAAARESKRELAREKLRRAQAIIDELNRVLDMKQGEVARNLREIYNFSSRHLIDSTLNGNAAGYEEVARILAELREAWNETIAAAEAIPA
ncbi:MAG TPA: flagellar export chaperone FliS [Gaiellaceae bacterium]|jgi:flagellar protein FliS